MSRPIIRSIREDINNFKNLIPYRIQKIKEAEAAPLPESYGVNKLSEKLHPKTQQLVISSARMLNERIRILDLTSASGEVAFFRAGQGVNVKADSHRTFFPISSLPGEKNYRIMVFSDAEDRVSEFLFRQPEGTIVETSGPEGLFYYSALRDRKDLVFVCDVYGCAPVLSISGELAGTDKAVRIILLNSDKGFNGVELFNQKADNIRVESAENTKEICKELSLLGDNCNLFVSGCEEFCTDINNFIKSSDPNQVRVRFNVVFLKESVPSEKTYKCKVIYRNEAFEFECSDKETLLSALERNNIPTQSKCKVGECGYCRCKLLSGETEVSGFVDIDSRREADKKYGFIHPCRTIIKSDVVVAI